MGSGLQFGCRIPHFVIICLRFLADITREPKDERRRETRKQR